MWFGVWKPRPSSLDPHRRKAAGVPGGGDVAVGRSLQNWVQIWMSGPMHCQPVQQQCWRKASLPKTFREPRKTRWSPPWTGKAVGSWVAVLAFRSEQIWVIRWVNSPLLPCHCLTHKICLVKMHIYFSSSVSSSVQILTCFPPNCLFLFFSHSQKNFSALCIDLSLQLELVYGSNMNQANVKRLKSWKAHSNTILTVVVTVIIL